MRVLNVHLSLADVAVPWGRLLGPPDTAWSSLTADAAIVSAVAVYAFGTIVVLRRHGRRWSPGRTLSFLLGSLALFVAVGSALASYDDLSPQFHVVQHVVLMMVAPPLLVAAEPIALAAQSLPRRWQRRAVWLSTSRGAAWSTGPFAWILYYATMPLYFLTPLYALSVRDGAIHDASHLMFFLLGLLFWSGLLAAGSRRRPGVGIAAVIAGMPLEAGLGFALAVWPWPLRPGSLAATHGAGQLFLILATLTSTGVLLVLFGRWAAADERRVRRQERRSASKDALRPAAGDGV